MPKEFPRTRRIGEQIQRELALLIREDIKDPRIGMVSVTSVIVTRDLSHAKVYVSVLGDTEQADASISVLSNAAGFLRHKLGKILHIRVIPELRFYHDRSLEERARMGALINAAIASDKGNVDEE